MGALQLQPSLCYPAITAPFHCVPPSFLPAVQEARGHVGSAGAGSSLSLLAHRPNAHGGALNRAHTKLLPTAGNMGRLDIRFNSGSVRVRDDAMGALGGLGGVGAGSAVVNQVRAAHSGKAAAAAGTRSKDRSDRATGACVGVGGCAYVKGREKVLSGG